MAAEALEKSVLEAKDKEQLFAIAQALGIKTSGRAAKATLINKILESTGVTSGRPAAPGRAAPAPAAAPPAEASTAGASTAGASSAPPAPTPAPAQEPLADWEVALGADAGAPPATGTSPSPVSAARAGDPPPADGDGGNGARSAERAGRAERADRAHDADAGDELDGGDEGDDDGEGDGDGDGDGGVDGGEDGPGESRTSRRRRRRRNKNRADAPVEVPAAAARPDDRLREAPRPAQHPNQRYDREPRESDAADAAALDPVSVAGYLDLREEGYGFLRVHGYVASRDDAYVPVRLTRQYGLRKGDHVTGLCRPAGRNEKNPAMLEIHTINGGDPELARSRPRFEELTAVFPNEQLRLERDGEPDGVTGRIIDLVAPIGKGQRGLIVAPPKAGTTTLLKAIADGIQQNHPDVELIVLLVDERPEEVTDLRRTVRGEVVASTFDRPSDEHTHVAELVIEKAKRLVELGRDVVVLVDGITRLCRAYNLATTPTGRTAMGGVDASAIHPVKRFFGAARNAEEGGSLTVLATARVDSGSRVDDSILEELSDAANMELRLDRRLAERRSFPAIDVAASSTRNEELLVDGTRLEALRHLRATLGGAVHDDGAVSGIEQLVERLATARTNAELLDDAARRSA